MTTFEKYLKWKEDIENCKALIMEEYELAQGGRKQYKDSLREFHILIELVTKVVGEMEENFVPAGC